MDENLDPEQIRQVNEQMGALASNTESVNDQFGKTTDTSTALNKSLSELHKKFEEFSKLTKNDLLKNLESVSKNQKEQAKDLDELSEALDDAAKTTKKSTTKHEEYVQQITQSLGFVKDATGNYVSAIRQQAQDRAKTEEEIIKTIGKENYERIKQEDKLAELEKKREENMKSGGASILSMAKSVNSVEGALSQANGAIMNMVAASGVGTVAYTGIGLVVQGLEVGLTNMKKVLDASIDAQISYTKSVLSGDRGQAVVAKRNEAIGKAQNDLIRQLGQLSIAAGAAGIALTLMAGPIGIVAKVIGLALGGAAIAAGTYAQYTAKAADTSLEFATQLAELRDKLYSGLVDLGKASLVGAGGMTELGNNLAKLQMSFAEVGKFTGIVKGATKELAMLGPGTVSGLNNFVNTAGTLIKSELGKQLEYMGITNEQQAEHVLKFMAQQERLGFAQERDAKKQAEAAGKYVIELDKLAVLTGATREEQEKARDQIMATEELRAKLLTANSDEERKKIQKQIDFATEMAASGQKEMAAGAARYFASGGRIVDEASQKFAMAMGKTGKRVLAGEGSTAENLIASTGEAMTYMKQYAKVSAISADATKDLGPKFAETMDANSRLMKAQEEAKKQGISVDEYLAKQKEVTDAQTKNQVELIRKQREDAIKDQANVIDKFGSATNLFKQGVDAFVGKTGTAGGAGPSKPVAAKSEADKKAELVGTLDEQIKAAKEQERQMKIAGASEEARTKQRDKIKKLEEDREKAEKESIEASRKAAQSALEATNLRNRQAATARLLPGIEAKLVKETDNLDKARSELAKHEKDLAAAQKSGDRGSTVKIQSQIKEQKAAIKEMEEGIAATRTQLKDTKTKAGIGTGTASQSDLSAMGLKIKQGDVQREGAEVDPKLLEIARQVQEQVPNFQYFSSFNDNFHKDSSSKHAKGKAFDFVLGKTPSKEEGQEIVSQLKSLGATLAIDEYNNPSSKATAGHIHAELAARNGGLFVGPDSGYQVTLHGKEKVIPLSKNASGENETVTKTELGDISSPPASTQPNLERFITIQTDLMSMIAEKLDALDYRLAKSNDIQSDILTYSST